MINTPTRFRTFTRIIIISCIVLVLLLIGFESVPLYRDDTLMTSQVQQQGAISQRIAKDVLLMEYIPDRRADALNELQNVVPNFENGQKVVSTLPPSMQSFLMATNPDFQDIDTAARKILSAPNASTNSLQVAIILDHERNYYLSVSQTVAALKSNAVNRKVSLFVIETIICVLLLIAGISFLIIVEWLIKRYEEIERKKKESEHAANADKQSL